MPLKIAFIAWNRENADNHLRQLAIDNAEQVERYDRQRGRVLLTDGTEIVSVHHRPGLEGCRFDQYIIADDRRMGVVKFHGAALNELDYRCQCSIVPAEYRCQFYNIDEEAPQHGTA